MTHDQRLGDFVAEKSIDDVALALNGMERLFKSNCDWIKCNCQRTDRSLSLTNILTSSSQYLRVAADNLQSHISVLALATRNLYELNVRVRLILQSDDELKSWISEGLTDNIQTLEGLLTLDTVTEMSEIRTAYRAEIDRLNALRTKFQLPIVKRPADSGSIAPAVGMGNDHKALFKMFSKLVHPSSYLTNNYETAASDQVRAVLQIHIQLYAWDTFNRICEALSVPKALRTLNGNRSGHA